MQLVSCNIDHMKITFHSDKIEKTFPNVYSLVCHKSKINKHIDIQVLHHYLCRVDIFTFRDVCKVDM